MRNKTLLMIIGLGLVVGPAFAGSDWQDKIVGKKLVNGKFSVTLSKNGSVSGSGIKGTWWEKGGKYCRKLTSPKRFAGTECQVVKVKGNKVSFDNQKGRKTTWVIK